MISAARQWLLLSGKTDHLSAYIAKILKFYGMCPMNTWAGKQENLSYRLSNRLYTNNLAQLQRLARKLKIPFVRNLDIILSKT